MTSARSLLVCLTAMLALAWPSSVRADAFGSGPVGIPAGTPAGLEDVGIDEHLDGPLPLDTPFRDHEGKATTLGANLATGKRPAVLVFAYHSCPVVCSLVLTQVTRALTGVAWTIGKDYDLVVLSINPRESLEKTAAKRAGMIADYNRAGSAPGFHFLVGNEADIERVAKAVGYKFKYDQEIDQYAHPSAIMIVKPNGQLARYLYGLEFPSNDVRLGLFEASEGRSISTIEQIVLYCYHYDPKGGKYVLVASRVMQVGGAATAFLLVGTLVAFWSRERKKGGLIAPKKKKILSSLKAGSLEPAPEPNA